MAACSQQLLSFTHNPSPLQTSNTVLGKPRLIVISYSDPDHSRLVNTLSQKNSRQHSANTTKQTTTRHGKSRRISPYSCPPSRAGPATTPASRRKPSQLRVCGRRRHAPRCVPGDQIPGAGTPGIGCIGSERGGILDAVSLVCYERISVLRRTDF